MAQKNKSRTTYVMLHRIGRNSSKLSAAKECMLKLMPLAKRNLSAFLKSLFSAKRITADMNELASEKWDSEEQLFFSFNSDCPHSNKKF